MAELDDWQSPATDNGPNDWASPPNLNSDEEVFGNDLTGKTEAFIRRFQVNAGEAFRHTIAGEFLTDYQQGALQNLAGTPQRTNRAGIPNFPQPAQIPNEQETVAIDRARAHEAQQELDYQQLPSADTIGGKATALLGQLAGGAASPENVLAPEVAPEITLGKTLVGKVAGRFIQGAINQAPVAALGTLGSEELRLARPDEKPASATELAEQIALGSTIGGVVHATPEVVRHYAPTQPPESIPTGPLADAATAQTPVGTILDAFGEGPTNNWGVRDFAADIDTAGIPSSALKGLAQTHADVVKGFNEAFQRPSAAQALVQAPANIADTLADARALGVIGEGENGWSGLAAPSDQDLAARQIAAAPETLAPEQPDVHAVARQIAPDVFGGPNGYDALTARQNTFRRWLDELAETRDANFEANPPLKDEMADVQSKIDGILGKVNGVEERLTKTKAAQLESLRDQMEDLSDRSREIARQDTGDMQRVRVELLKNDYKMRDLAEQVSAAYREARARNPTEETPVRTPESAAPEAAPVEVAPLETAQPAAAEPVAQEVVGKAIAAANEPTQAQEPLGRPVPADVAADVSQKLIAAGRPPEEAQAAAQLVAAHYESRAARFGGSKGTGAEIYAREAPEIRAGRARAAPAERVREFAQTARGKIAFRDAQSTITLMKDANASTFIHETGHQWLEELRRDAEDPSAPADLVKDMQTVRDYLGAKEGEDITTRQHEKFARSFERYMMEGVAPSKALAGVFAKFKQWLAQIYETVAKLRAPISDDIRDVFDRLLTKPGDEAVIAPEIEQGKDFADIHEADAKDTPPEHADPVRDVVEREIVQVAEQKVPDVATDLTNATEAGELATPTEGDTGRSEPTGSDARTIGDLEKPREVPEGGDRVGAESPDVRTESGAGSGDTAGEPRTEQPEPRQSDSSTGPTTDLIDKAGNIRLDNLNLPEDVDDALRQIARENDDFQEARFGSEGKQLHDSILAARKLTAQAAQEMAEAQAKAAAENATDQDLLAYQQAANRLTMIASRLATLTHSWGYAGQAFRMLEGIPDAASATTMAQLAERTKGMTLYQLRWEARFGQKLDTAAQKLKFLLDTRVTNWQRAKSMIIELFVNNLISGPITHTAYTIGNQSMNFWKALVETPTAAAISAARGAKPGERVYFGETAAQLFGMLNGAPDGWAAARKAWKTGIADPLPGALDALSEKQRENFLARQKQPGAIPGKIGEIIRLPSDSVSAIHAFGSTVAYTQELYRLAYRAASDAGLEGQAHSDAMAKFINDPPVAAITQARNEGLKMVLMKPSEMNSAFSKFKGIVNNSLPLKIIMPFMQVGANILHEGFLERTPLGFADKNIRDNLLGKNGTDAQTIQAGKIAAGTALSTAVVALTLNDVMSGGGSSNQNERALKRRGGWQPYSIRLGNYWVPYRKFLGPLGTLIAGVADMAEIGHTAEDKDLAQAAKAAVFGLSEVVADESWFMGASNFIDAARNWDKPQADRYFRDLATSFIPFSVGLSQTARLIDPYSRQVRDFSDAWRAKAPILSQDLFPRRDIFGEPIPSRLNVSPTIIRPDPVADALEKLQKFPSAVGRDIRGVKLSEQQYDDYSRIAGKLMHLSLSQLINSPGWASMPQNVQGTIVDRAVSAAREQARNQVMMQSIGTDNDIVAKATAAKTSKVRK